MKIEDWYAEIQKIVKAHSDLYIAIEDFCASPLSSGARDRLIGAMKVSKTLIDDNDN